MAAQIISWSIFAVLAIGSLGIISLHSHVDAYSSPRSGLAPLHITGLAVVVCGYSAICANSIKSFDLPFVFYTVLSLLAIGCFGLVVVHLRRRLVNEINTYTQ